MTFSAAIKAGVKRVVNCSSMARYGVGKPPFHEDDAPTPVDPYGIAKLGAETLLRNLAETHGFDYAIAVPHNIYGPRQRYCMEAGSMVKLVSGFKPIEAVSADDEVLIGGETARIVDAFHVGQKAAIRVTLETGQQVTVGRDHLFKVIPHDSDRPVWKGASKLSASDMIVSDTGDFATFDRDGHAFKWGQFLGLLISDGHYNDDYECNIACCIDEDKSDLRELLGEHLSIKYTEQKRGTFHIYSKEFMDGLSALGLRAIAHNKIIPNAVFALGHDTLAGVLSGMFSGDGWVTKKQNVIGIASVSEKLMRQTQKLLLAFGIRSNLSMRDPEDRPRMIEGRSIKPTRIWYLALTGESVTRFQKIGFVYGRKNKVLAEKVGIKEVGRVCLPRSKFKEVVQKIGPTLPLSIRQAKPPLLNNNSQRELAITRFSVGHTASLMTEWLESDEGRDAIPEYHEYISKLRDQWDELLSLGPCLQIKKIEETEADLYDISVDSIDHSYVGDGLICHNCDPYRNVASIMANLMLQGRPPVIYGDGEQQRCFSYISDTVGCLGQMATSDKVVGEVINIGPDEGTISINELSSLLANITGFNGEPVYMPGRPQEVKHATCSADKARKLLGYETKVFVDEGMRLLVDSIRERGAKPFDYHFGLEFTTAKTPKTWTDRLF
jgi:nucleoside-diphosphate-sugar epimerase